MTDHRIFLCDIDPYAGPLDLLLYLVRERRLTISEIRLSEIADQYVDFMHDMEGDLDLELLGGYLVVSATLVQIKSRLLLPNAPGEDEIEEAVDLKQQLLVRLAENLRFQQVAEELESRPQMYRDFWPRPDQTDELEEVQLVVRRPGLYELVESFRGALDRMRKRIPPIVKQAGRTLREHVHDMSTLLHGMFKSRARVRMDELDEALHSDPWGQVYSFLAMLQLVKGHVLQAEQGEICGPIWLEQGAEWSDEDFAALVDEEDL